jgi:hypothetical protein
MGPDIRQITETEAETMMETGTMKSLLAHEYKVNAAIFAPGSLFAFFTFTSADLYAALPTLIVLGKLLLVQVVIPGIFALARLIKRTRNDRRIDRQEQNIERLKEKLSAVQSQLDPMTKDEVTRFLKEFAGP